MRLFYLRFGAAGHFYDFGLDFGVIVGDDPVRRTEPKSFFPGSKIVNAWTRHLLQNSNI